MGVSTRIGLTAALLAAATALVAPAGAFGNGTISGTLTPGLNNFQVEAYLPGAATPTASACTLGDNSGNYTLSVPAGTYEVKFAGGSGGGCTPDTTYAVQWWNAHGPRRFADPVPVADLGNAPNINATLALGAEVSGTVTVQAGGAPLMNVTVELIDADGTIPGTACTAADGTYTMKKLFGGAYQARFTANGSCGPTSPAGNYQTLYYQQSTTQAGATSVNIGLPGETVTNINAQMFQAFTLTVQKSGSGTGDVLSVPAGIDCGATCSALFSAGSPVGLAASPTGGSTFTGWSGGGCSGTGGCNVTMNSDQTVTATFTAGSGGGGGGGGGGGAEERPDTKIDSSKIKAKKGKATFTFSGSGGVAPLKFECLLAGKSGSPGYQDCTSPIAFKKLRKGRYTFFVRARGANDLADQSPADQVFKSKRKKRRR